MAKTSQGRILACFSCPPLYNGEYDVVGGSVISYFVTLIHCLPTRDSFFLSSQDKLQAATSSSLQLDYQTTKRRQNRVYTINMRATALFPMACAIVAFVLGMLCLFAGHKPGFMEDYHIITVSHIHHSVH